jgi:hypothetical protein
MQLNSALGHGHRRLNTGGDMDVQMRYQPVSWDRRSLRAAEASASATDGDMLALRRDDSDEPRPSISLLISTIFAMTSSSSCGRHPAGATPRAAVV